MSDREEPMLGLTHTPGAVGYRITGAMRDGQPVEVTLGGPLPGGARIDVYADGTWVINRRPWHRVWWRLWRSRLLARVQRGWARRNHLTAE